MSEYHYILYYRKLGAKTWNKCGSYSGKYALCRKDLRESYIKADPIDTDTRNNMENLYQHFYSLVVTGRLRYKDNTKIEISLDKINIYTITLNKRVVHEIVIDSFDLPDELIYETYHGNLKKPKADTMLAQDGTKKQ